LKLPFNVGAARVTAVTRRGDLPGLKWSPLGATAVAEIGSDTFIGGGAPNQRMDNFFYENALSLEFRL
jgi:hypothetical protein